MIRTTWTTARRVTAMFVLLAATASGAAEPVEPTESETTEPMQLTLEQCIETGIEHSVRFLSQEETFILQQLAALLERHNYGPLVTSTLSAGTGSGDTSTETASLTIAKRLLTGGDVRLDAQTSGSQAGGTDDDYSSSVGLSIEQPLLRGAGRLVAREDLTQAERDLVYAGRDLILFKQQFLIDIVQQYYQLVRQLGQIRNQKEKLEGARWLRNRAQALNQREMASEIDVLRAQNNLLRAENDLNDAKESYDLQLDRLKLDLGLPIEQTVQLVETTLAYRAVQVELGPGVEAALRNRLDLKTAQGSAQDAHRALAIARNNLRGDLDLTARVGYSTESGTTFGDQRLGEPEWSVGVAYGIPLDRTAEKTSYRQRLIAYARALRQANRVRDEVVLDVRKTVRDLRQAAATITFQEKNIELAEKRLQRAVADLERGEATTRDVEEAQDELLDAQNALIRAQVDYIIATLQMKKDTGELDFEQQWRELIQ